VRRVALLAVFLLFGACVRPSTHNTTSVLRETAGNLGKIRSGNMHVVLQTSTKDGKPSGFQIDGPFSFDSPGSLPVLDVHVKRFDGDKSQTNRLVSTGSTAYVDRKGHLVPVDPSELDGLNGLGGKSSSSGPLGTLDIDGWLAGKPKISAGGLVGSTDTDKVTADLDVGAVMNGLIQLAQSFGVTSAQQLTSLSRSERERVRRAVKDSTLEVWSGRKDKIMRRLVMNVEFATNNPQLAAKLKALSGITLRFEAKITDLNKRIPSPTVR
jgi:hypothetical protein